MIVASIGRSSSFLKVRTSFTTASPAAISMSYDVDFSGIGAASRFIRLLMKLSTAPLATAYPMSVFLLGLRKRRSRWPPELFLDRSSISISLMAEGTILISTPGSGAITICSSPFARRATRSRMALSDVIPCDFQLRIECQCPDMLFPVACPSHLPVRLRHDAFGDQEPDVPGRLSGQLLEFVDVHFAPYATPSLSHI